MLAWAEAQLEPFDVGISAATLVQRPDARAPAVRRNRQGADRQAARSCCWTSRPRPSTWKASRKLTGIIRDLTAQGTGDHLCQPPPARNPRPRRPRHHPARRGPPAAPSTSPRTFRSTDLVCLMVGRDIDSEYPPKPASPDRTPCCRFAGPVRRRVPRRQLRRAHAGEILGFAGAEGNGQREALRAIGGLEEASGARALRRPAGRHSPRRAPPSPAGFSSSAPTGQGEAIFPDLGVQKNMVLSPPRPTLPRGGFVCGPSRAAARPPWTWSGTSASSRPASTCR